MVLARRLAPVTMQPNGEEEKVVNLWEHVMTHKARLGVHRRIRSGDGGVSTGRKKITKSGDEL